MQLEAPTTEQITLPSSCGTRGHSTPLGLGERADERAARASLRGQVARLERRLAAITVASFPHRAVVTATPAARGARILTLGELEAVRDALAGRIAEGSLVLHARSREQERARVLLERMLLAPGEYRRVRIAQSDIGEGGCGVWHVKPRLGLVGMLMGWWQVKVSSGCPLAT